MARTTCVIAASEQRPPKSTTENLKSDLNIHTSLFIRIL